MSAPLPPMSSVAAIDCKHCNETVMMVNIYRNYLQADMFVTLPLPEFLECIGTYAVHMAKHMPEVLEELKKWREEKESEAQ